MRLAHAEWKNEIPNYTAKTDQFLTHQSVCSIIYIDQMPTGTVQPSNQQSAIHTSTGNGYGPNAYENELESGFLNSDLSVIRVLSY